MPIQRITSGVIADGAIVATDIADGIVTGAKLASGAANTNIGYTAANKAGETFSGDVNISKSSPYLYVTSTGGTNQNIWFKDNANNTFAIESQPTAQGGVYISNRTATAPIYVRTSNTGGTLVTSMTLNQYGIGVGDATPSSGMGIKFPATQSASSDANTLDDYEEGTWTPSVGGNATYTLQQGHYVKIGQLVYIFADMEINLIGTGNTSSITNAPFTSFDSNTPTGYPINISYFNALANSITWLTAYIADNATTISFAGNTTAATSIQNNGFAVFGNSTRIVLSGCYRTSA